MAKFDRRDQFLAKLAKLPPKARDAIKIALEQGAQQIMARQKALAPHDEGVLIDSIKVKRGDRITGKGKDRKTIKGDPELTVNVTAGDDKAFYARMVEFGTSPHINEGQFPGTQNPGRRATPFFYPGYRAERKSVKSRISRAIRKSAKEVASG